MPLPGYLVTDAEVLDGYRLRVKFEDRTEGTVDLSDLVARGGVFTALRDPGFFRQARADADAGTVVWPNELDVAPEELYARAHKAVRPDGGVKKETAAGKVRRRPSTTRSRRDDLPSRRTPAGARSRR
jgi:hypothetical protein